MVLGVCAESRTRSRCMTSSPSIRRDQRPPYSIAEFVALSAGRDRRSCGDSSGRLRAPDTRNRITSSSTATVMSGWPTWDVRPRLVQTTPRPERFVRSCDPPRRRRSSLQPKERSHQPPTTGRSVSRCSNCATAGIHTGARRRRRLRACAPAILRERAHFPDSHERDRGTAAAAVAATTAGTRP